MPAADAAEIVQVFPLPGRRGLFGRLTGSGRPAPLIEPGFDGFTVLRGAGGAVELRPGLADAQAVRAASQQTAPAGDGSLVRVRTTPQSLEWAFAAVASDARGHAWDMLMGGTWRVSRPDRFLQGYALGIVSPAVGLSRQLAESWMTHLLRHRVGDAVRAQSIDDLRDRNALPAVWWEKRLGEWLDPYGIAATVAAIDWQSADAQRAAAEKRQADDLARMDRERDRQRKAELMEAQQQARYDAERYRIEAEKRFSQQEKYHELELLERRHRAELLATERELEEARRAGDRAALEHEVEMARLRNNLEQAQQAKAREAEADARHLEVVESLAKAQTTLDRLALLSEPLLQRLMAGDPRTRFQAAERLTSPEFGISADALARLGYRTGPQDLVARLREMAHTGPAVAVRMVKLHSRDIGTARVKALPVNSSLQFEFTSSRPGYVTIVNIGTSGALYLHVPNAYVAPAAAEVVAGHPHAIPGGGLLPFERLQQFGLDYVETGPPGWEHVAVIVSDHPLITPPELRQSSGQMPFIELSYELFDSVLESATIGGNSWSVGLLSFLVE